MIRGRNAAVSQLPLRPAVFFPVALYKQCHLASGERILAREEILTSIETSDDSVVVAEPVRFSLRALFALTTLVAFTATGDALNGFIGANNGSSRIRHPMFKLQKVKLVC